MVDLLTPRESALRTVRDRLSDRAEKVVGGTLDGEPVVTIAKVDEAFAEPLPPASEHAAEVLTPSRVVVSAECPRCGLTAGIALDISTELLVDSSGSTLRLKGKSKAASHVCGQTTMFDGQAQSSFELADIVGPSDDEPS